ncbi:MAG: HIT family protein [Kiritimatiellia bacterium]
MNKDCIFCKIVQGAVPASKVYEDENTVAFMDVQPVVKGHVLVVPREHCDPITETPPEVLSKLIAVVRKVARSLTEGLGADGINVSQANGKVAGQVVPHIHFHVIPRFSNDGHSWNWDPKEYDSTEEMDSYADKIRKALQ